MAPNYNPQLVHLANIQELKVPNRKLLIVKLRIDTKVR